MNLDLLILLVHSVKGDQEYERGAFAELWLAHNFTTHLLAYHSTNMQAKANASCVKLRRRSVYESKKPKQSVQVLSFYADSSVNHRYLDETVGSLFACETLEGQIVGTMM